MIALRLTEVRQFMSKLLLTDTFDHFLLVDAEIVTFNTFRIDGYIQKDFYKPDAAGNPVQSADGTDSCPEYSAWSCLREYCFSIIRGKRTPLRFKFVFRLSPENIARLIAQEKLDFRPEDVQGLYLNISFGEDGLTCITGTSMNTFTMDKSLEKSWDTMVQKFFSQKEIPFEQE